MVAISEPLHAFELVTYILVGLRMECDPLVTFLTTRPEPTTLDDLYGHLLSHELCLEHHHSVVDLSISSTSQPNVNPNPIMFNLLEALVFAFPTMAKERGVAREVHLIFPHLLPLPHRPPAKAALSLAI